MATRPSTTGTDTSDWRIQPWAEVALVASFALALAGPGLATLAGVDRAGRPDATDPGTAPTAVVTLEDRLASLTAAFDGHFAFRQAFVHWQAALRARVPGVSPLPSVIRGRDGWWYYGEDGAIEDLTNAAPFPDHELVEWRDTLQHTRDWLAARGIAYVFVLVPDKHTVYPEHLPPSIHRRPGPSRADELAGYLRAHSTVPVVDLRRPLVAAKTGERLYHRTDSHWNDRGALVGYQQIMDALVAQRATLMPPHDRTAFAAVVRTEPGWDLAEMLSLTRELPEENLALTPLAPRHARVVEPAQPHPLYIGPRLVTAVADPHLPRAVFYRDSFGSALVPFLAEHFQRLTVLWEYDVLPETIRAEQPDVVIHEWAGRRLHNRGPFDAIVEDAAAAAETGSGLSSSAPARR